MHRKHATWLALLLLVVAAVFAIGGDEKGKEEKPGKSWYDKIKISGELRTRFEGRAKFSPAYPADTEHALTLARTRLTIEARPAPNLRAVIQLQDSRVWGEEPSTAANLQNIDLHQGYFIWEKIGGSSFALKLGRQELSYGDERLIGAFGWSNVGRSFDAIKLSYRGGGFFVDGFTATTRETIALEQDASFSGVYAGFSGLPFGKLEGYALVKLDDREAFASELDPTALGTLSIQTFGVRAVGPGGKSPFSYGAELAFQTGDFGDDEHEAWAAHLRAAYKLPTSLRLQIRAEFTTSLPATIIPPTVPTAPSTTSSPQTTASTATSTSSAGATSRTCVSVRRQGRARGIPSLSTTISSGRRPATTMSTAPAELCFCPSLQA